MCRYILAQAHRMYTTKSEPSLSCGLGVLLMCQRWVMDCNTCATPWGVSMGWEEAVAVGGGREHVGVLCTFYTVLM